MRRRIFIAIPISEGIKSRVAKWQKEYDYLSVRWIKPENLHITVVPPWYVSEDELYETTKVLEEEAVKNASPFEVQFEKILFGPPYQPPRLIWAEGGTPKELADLKERVENTFLANPKTGFLKKEKRPAKLHLTIARFRPGSLKKLPPLDGGVDWRFEVDSVDLMESELKRTGAEYTAVQIFNFQRPIFS